jgi:hypothetical protein
MEGAAKKAAARNLPEEQARKILNEIRLLGGDNEIRFKSLSQYASEWLQSRTSGEATHIRYSGVINQFIEHIGKQRPASSIEGVTADDVKSFRDSHRNDGKSATTASLR